MKNKKSIELLFYEQKWFKLVFLFSFFGWLLYNSFIPYEINKNELLELDLTVTEKFESSGRTNPIKISFSTKEFSNKFGIYVGGTFGRWTEVTNCLEKNRKIKVKIHKDNKLKLNKVSKVIPIYYLYSNKSGLIFNEEQFNQGEKNSNNRYIVFCIIIFIFCLWGILKN